MGIAVFTVAHALTEENAGVMRGVHLHTAHIHTLSAEGIDDLAAKLILAHTADPAGTMAHADNAHGHIGLSATGMAGKCIGISQGAGRGTVKDHHGLADGYYFRHCRFLH